MPAIAAEILIIVLLLLINGLFAMAEIAVISARKTRLQQWANEGNVKARAALALANAPGHLLFAVRMGITLVSILVGAFSGATLAKEVASHLRALPLFAPYSEIIALGLVVLGIILLSLFIGELALRQVALHHRERIASVVAAPMRVLSALVSPAVRLLGVSTGTASRFSSGPPIGEPPITQEEIKILIEQGTEAGVFEKAEREMVESVFRLRDQRVDALMTPRHEIVWLDLGDSLDDIRRKITTSAYSRFPVGQESLDNALGIVQAKDLLAHCLAGQAVDLQVVLHPPLFVPESIPASKVLELFKTSHMPVALVVDEYGVIQGLISLDDLLTAIIGDVSSVEEATEPPAVQREDGSWLLDGMLPVDKFKEIFHIEQLPGEDRGHYQTLGGFVMMYMEHIPSAGQHFAWGGFRFEVLDMDVHRVDKVLIVPLRTNPPGPVS